MNNALYISTQDGGRDEGVMSTNGPRLAVLSLQCLAKQNTHTDARLPSAAMSLLLKVIMNTRFALWL
jgi:hypothetical protein